MPSIPQILRLVAAEGPAGSRALRASCSSCRDTIDSKCWTIARGNLRKAGMMSGGMFDRLPKATTTANRPLYSPLPPPPSAAASRLRRIELRFDRQCRNSVGELTPDDRAAFVAALRDLRLGSISSSLMHNAPRCLALYFGNFSLTTSMVRHVHPKIVRCVIQCTLVSPSFAHFHPNDHRSSPC